MPRVLLLPALVLAGCVWISDADEVLRLDGDGDGVQLDEDCDDSDPGLGLPRTWCVDGDGDGYGLASACTEACTAPEGFVEDDGDCDDGDAAVHPGAAEYCGGGDEDCDGLVDDADEAPLGTHVFYTDADGDGWGDPDATIEACAVPAGATARDGDCDDGRADVNPDAEEVCGEADEDCDGLVDDEDDDVWGTATWYLDYDADGYGTDVLTVEACEPPEFFVDNDDDCDDLDDRVHPGAEETDCADPTDYNCDSSVAWADADGDGWAACAECDDAEATTHPGAPEYCDGADNDCDGATDEEPVDGDLWYADGDGDGYGDAGITAAACAQPSGFVRDASDCDDTDGSVHPGVAEAVCDDGVDDDCDGLVDTADPDCGG
ncbi:MAG: putative metal-binding motif-containing protein [Pseudomonadota bacterium]